MGTIPLFNNAGLFDRYCKVVLNHEAIDYLREMAASRERQASLSTMDSYPSDSVIFSSHGCDLRIDNEFVAEAFADLGEQEQSILILHCVLGLSDGKIGELMGLSRYAVRRRRTKSLDELRSKLTAVMPKGG